MRRRSEADADRKLSSQWNPPGHLGGDLPGSPVACLATTFEFKAEFYERELLPRFLGLRFDATEGDRPFFLESHLKLLEVQACVMVDNSKFDPAQSSLLWDQLPVFVPSGIQHSKVTVLAWEGLIRVIVTSANLTPMGYRRNREVAGVLDFYDHADSAPLSVALDILDFLKRVAGFARANPPSLERLTGTIDGLVDRTAKWTQAPDEFRPRAELAVHFTPTAPAGNGRPAASALSRVRELWGNRQTRDVAVMTPFVGEGERPSEGVIGALLSVPLARECTHELAVPGRWMDDTRTRKRVELPSAFRNVWAKAWGIHPEETPVWVVPPARDDTSSNRVLHAKAIYLNGDSLSLLLCGSSNFTPHGMGVGAYNLEANLCYLDRLPASKRGPSLDDRLPVDWHADRADDAFWPNESVSPEDAEPSGVSLPPAFLWATLNQRLQLLTVGLAAGHPLPEQWSIRLLSSWGGRVIASSSQGHESGAADRLELQLPPEVATATITVVHVEWRDPDGEFSMALLPVLAEGPDALLDPVELRGLRAESIIAAILSGRDPAELLESQLRGGHGLGRSSENLDPLKLVKSDAFLTYRVRRLGRALGILGRRLQEPPLTERAFRTRVYDHPLAPMRLAEALSRDWELPAGNPHRAALRTGLAFALGEIAHLLARTWAAIERADLEQADTVPLRQILLAAHGELRQQRDLVLGEIGSVPGLATYLAEVDASCQELFAAPSGGSHAG